MIDRFEGEYEFLSNFAHSPIVLDGKTYDTVEHAFQAFKADNDREREWIRLARTPGQAKRRGRRCKMRPDWDEARISIMIQCLLAKFTQHSELRRRLIATEDQLLIEGNTWGDRFWGQVDSEGQNWLGQCLMKIRDILLDLEWGSCECEYADVTVFGSEPRRMRVCRIE